MSILPSILVWARSLPTTGALRIAIYELALFFAENPKLDWIDLTDDNAAALCKMSVRTFQQLKQSLRLLMRLEGSRGQQKTRYFRPAFESAEMADVTAKSADTNAKNAEVHQRKQEPSLSSPLSHLSKAEGEKREREPSAAPPLEELLTPELFAFARALDRPFTDQNTRHCIAQMVDDRQAKGLQFVDWHAAARKWLRDERNRIPEPLALWPAAVPDQYSQQGAQTDERRTGVPLTKSQRETAAMHRFMASPVRRDEDSACGF